MGTFSQSACFHSLLSLKKTKKNESRRRSPPCWPRFGFSLSPSQVCPNLTAQQLQTDHEGQRYLVVTSAHWLSLKLTNLLWLTKPWINLSNWLKNSVLELMGFSQELGLPATLLLKPTCHKLLKDLSTINSPLHLFAPP